MIMLVAVIAVFVSGHYSCSQLKTGNTHVRRAAVSKVPGLSNEGAHRLTRRKQIANRRSASAWYAALGGRTIPRSPCLHARG
jgi:hypothetical protein